MMLTEPSLSPPPPPSIATDADLVSLCRTGDPGAMNLLADRYRQTAYLLALQLLGNREDALDVAQDAMLRFFATLNRFDKNRPVKPWLFQIVRNRVHDLRRRRRVRPHQSIDEEREDGYSIELVDESMDPERDASKAQLKIKIWQSLSKLSTAQREILVLRDYHDLAYADIAKLLDIPIGTVMSRLHTARKNLRQVVKEDLRSLMP